MQFLMRMPKDLIQRSVLIAVTLVNMSACAVSADEQMVGSTPSSQEPVTDTEREPISSEVRFRKIQGILGEIDAASKMTPSESTPNAKPREAVPDATAPSRTSKTTIIDSELQSNTQQPVMAKQKKMHSMSSTAGQPIKQSMGKCKGMMCNKMMGRSMMGQSEMPDTTLIPIDKNLPGYPEAPHLYHLGEVAFFIDHTKHLALSNLQIQTLTSIKTQWMAQQNEINSQIATYEQALWKATSVGQPDMTTIRNTIANIESLNGQLRLAFITRVGQAVTVLTADQVDLLTSAEQLP